MSMNDPLANVLSALKNAEKVNKKELRILNCSKVIMKVLEILHNKGYIGEFEKIENGRGGELRISLLGNINNVGVIKPRFSVKADGFEKYEKRYLPARGFGVLIVSTNKGIMLHEEAKEQNTGGKLLCYCY